MKIAEKTGCPIIPMAITNSKGLHPVPKKPVAEHLCLSHVARKPRTSGVGKEDIKIAGCPIIPMAITNSAEIFENHLPFIRPCSSDSSPR